MLKKSLKTCPIAPLSLALLGALGVALAAAPTQAQTQVSLDTGDLNGLGTFYLDFQQLDGNGVGDGNTTFVLSDLFLTGGALGIPLPNVGTVAGDPTTAAGLTLTDSDPGGIAIFEQPITVTGPASHLSFTLTSTSTPPLDAPIPDTLVFSMLQGDGVTPLPTQGPNGVELVVSEYDSPSPTVTGYATSADSPISLTPLVGSPSTSPSVPEPATVALLPVGLLALFPVAIRAWRKCPR